MSANDYQVDGSHYKDLGAFQPWDVLKAWLTPEEYRGYQKGVAIVYLAREKHKGGDRDISKGLHHLTKLSEDFATIQNYPTKDNSENNQPIQKCPCGGRCYCKPKPSDPIMTHEEAMKRLDILRGSCTKKPIA